MIGTDVKVTVTDKAAEQIRKIMAMEKKEGHGLRVGSNPAAVPA